jgi:hypothetical protein
VAQMEDSMIEFLLIFLICSIWFGGKELLKYFEQKDYERRKFYLLVAEELDRLEKMTEDQKELSKPNRMTQWQMRN